jgi:hypothetical protein
MYIKAADLTGCSHRWAKHRRPHLWMQC